MTARVLPEKQHVEHRGRVYGQKQELHENLTIMQIYTPESCRITIPLFGYAQSLAYIALIGSMGPVLIIWHWKAFSGQASSFA
jgi:hypothetical protein